MADTLQVCVQGTEAGYLSHENRQHLFNYHARNPGISLCIINSQAPHPGFEDMCVLQAKHRDDKYTGSYEQIAKTIKLFCSPAYKQASLVQFFKMMVINTQVQNGDAHLKNFGLLYGCPASVRLPPAYDIVSTTCLYRMIMLR